MLEIFRPELLTLYALIASFMATMTYAEGRGNGWSLYRVLGLSLSLVWPLVIVVFTLLVMLGVKHQSRKSLNN